MIMLPPFFSSPLGRHTFQALSTGGLRSVRVTRRNASGTVPHSPPPSRIRVLFSVELHTCQLGRLMLFATRRLEPLCPHRIPSDRPRALWEAATCLLKRRRSWVPPSITDVVGRGTYLPTCRYLTYTAEEAGSGSVKPPTAFVYVRCLRSLPLLLPLLLVSLPPLYRKRKGFLNGPVCCRRACLSTTYYRYYVPTLDAYRPTPAARGRKA
ncbi:hypothetical protein GGS23DRAFT_65208 [Durotheca rogersii]|uniref:uncharacterized protein n=1 Tax=Durotheca rogersii TaxID=419775 RepID=UPI0022202EC7|nr:uncharacterized protein GGS23DRAFT_65208 [Durotheca rogersii]KAI5862754.1 hypothetical protein GGS23DRAFT_65208 [Durotheca rogersii]